MIPNNNPVKLVCIDTATMTLFAYEGKKQVEVARMNTDETPIKFIKETIQDFRIANRSAVQVDQPA